MIAIAIGVASAIISFAGSVVMIRAWIPVAKREGMVGKDMNKAEKNEVAEVGGFWAIISSIFAFLVFEAIYAFVYGKFYDILEVYSITILLILSSILGFLDDILGWKRGLPAYIRILAMAPMALPLMIIRHNAYILSLPFFGKIDLGLLYPLVVIPVGVLGASNAFNMIAGYNGLEAGMGLVLLIFTLAFSLAKGLSFTSYASIIMIGAIIGFLLYNKYPAKVFPGNTFTYAFGAFYAGLVILGDATKFGLTLFFLYYIELILFLRGILHGVYKENFANVSSDNSLEPPYSKSYSLTHLSIKVIKKLKGKAKERDVVLFLMLLQSIVGLICLIIYL